MGNRFRSILYLVLTLSFFSALSLPAAAEVPVESQDGLYSSEQHTEDSPEWVKDLAAARDDNVTQLFVVGGMGMDKSTATVSMHERDAQGNWKQILSSPAFIGLRGLVPDAERIEGCQQTPIGTYTFNRAFGFAEDPGCALHYTRINTDLYWSGDPREHYNELVDICDCPDLDIEDSEHLADYPFHYQYCLNISFNAEETPGRGDAIFLHCFGPEKPYTMGCVAVPENIMKRIMQEVRPDCVVLIDTLENLGGSFPVPSPAVQADSGT